MAVSWGEPSILRVTLSVSPSLLSLSKALVIFILPAREEAIDIILDAVALKKNGTVKRIYVTGCLPQRYSDELKKEIPEVKAVEQVF